MSFFGHAYAAATYLVDDPVFGWLGYGGNVSQADGTVVIEPHDGARTRLFVAPTGLWITLEAGKITRAEYLPSTGRLTLTLDAATPVTPVARLFVERTNDKGAAYATPSAPSARGGYTIALSNVPVRFSLYRTPTTASFGAVTR